MAAFLSKIGAWKEGLEAKLDNLMGNLTDKVLETVQPKVQQVITTHVDNFKTTTLKELPTTAEQELREKAENSSVAWLASKILRDHTDELVQKLIVMFTPGIDSATSGLSQQSTDLIMSQLRNMLTIEGAAAQGSGQSEAVAQQIQRCLNLGADEGSDTAPRGDVQDRGLFSSSIKLDNHMSGWEASTREMVHPLFVRMEEAIWAMVPDTIEKALQDLLDGKSDQVESAAREVGEAPQDASRSFGSIGTWAARKAMDVVLSAASPRLRELLTQLVSALEESSLADAFQLVRAKLMQFHLLTSMEPVPQA